MVNQRLFWYFLCIHDYRIFSEAKFTAPTGAYSECRHVHLNAINGESFPEENLPLHQKKLLRCTLSLHCQTDRHREQQFLCSKIPVLVSCSTMLTKNQVRRSLVKVVKVHLASKWTKTHEINQKLILIKNANCCTKKWNKIKIETKQCLCVIFY